MRFWDSSALAALVLNEPRSESARELAADGSGLVGWYLTVVEVVSAVERRVVEERIPPDQRVALLGRVDRLFDKMQLVTEGLAVVSRARSVLAMHRLKAADALQLAAALVVAEGDPRAFEFVSFDRRLVEAASREGFRVPRSED